MTSKRILDSFSTTLMQDERILSAQERALVAAVLQHAKAATGESPETQEAVQRVIAAAVGETVAHRAFSVLGGSIVEQILESSSSSPNDSTSLLTADIYAGKQPRRSEPQPPRPGPQPHDKPLRTPGVPSPPGPQPPGAPLRTPGMPSPPGPQPPGAPLRTPGVPSSPGPEPPGHAVRTTVVSEATVAATERPAALPAQCVVLDEFLAPQELEELMRFALEHEADFRASEVVSPTAEGGVVNYEHRRSRVLMDLGQYEDQMLKRIKAVLPQVLEKLGMQEVPITGVEAQITASNDGDFFHFHSDNGSEKVASRYLTFVYFFYREPRQFEGGELRLHDVRLEGETYVSEGSYQTILPQQNQIVFFPCELMHEVTPVESPSRLFADSRFTLNGWLRR